MDLGLDAPDSEEDKAAPPETKRRAVTSGARDHKRVLELLLKIGLSTMLATRVLKSCSIDTWMFKVTVDLIVEGLKTTRNYAKKVAKMTAEQRDKIGPPHLHLFNTLLGILVKVAGAWQEPLKEWMDKMKSTRIAGVEQTKLR